MAHTRRLQGIAHDINGLPWASKQIWITRTPTQFAAHAILPVDQIKLTTDIDGAYSVDLEVNATYLVELVGSDTVSGSTRRYAPGSRFDITMPDGVTPVSLEMIRAADIPVPDDPTLVNLVAQVASDLTDHEADHANPHAVIAAQLPDLDSEVSASPEVAANTLARHTHANKSTLDATTASYTTAEQSKLSGIATGATANATDAQLRDRTTHTGAQAISTVTGLQASLDSKAAVAALTSHTGDTANPHGVTAAQTGAYTTAQTDSALALRQPLDADLTAIAALVAAWSGEVVIA